jgi:hypothetical protein
MSGCEKLEPTAILFPNSAMAHTSHDSEFDTPPSPARRNRGPRMVFDFPRSFFGDDWRLELSEESSLVWLARKRCKWVAAHKLLEAFQPRSGSRTKGSL